MWVKKAGIETTMLCTHVDDSFVTAMCVCVCVCVCVFVCVQVMRTRSYRFATECCPSCSRFDGTANMDAKEYVGMGCASEFETSCRKCVYKMLLRGTGTPKNRDEVNRREVCECDG